MKSAIFGRGGRRRRLAAIGLAAIGLVCGVGVVGAQSAGTPAYLATFPDFNPAVTSQMPGDVDVAFKKKLENSKQFSMVQREFDLYSWQMFMALNWPTNDQGQPGPSLGANADPAWSRWHVSSSIYTHDGSRPTACDRPHEGRTAVASRDPTKPVSRGLRPFPAQLVAGAHPRKTRLLGIISAVGELHADNLDEIGQAFTGPLIDQNGEFVFYEILIDPNEVKYLCDNGLYNINGQIAFAKTFGKKPPKVVMPWGTDGKDWSGAFELKLAWKILTPGKDDSSRFYTADAVVMDPGADGNPKARKVKVGLVGMHIGHKTESSPQWIWSTFEQIDNVDVDQVAHPKVNPSFFNPGCWICAVNQQPQQVNGAYPRTPVQVWRAIQIPADKQALNRQAQAALRGMGSVWQYYQLIDTQWPTDPGPPSPWNSGLPNAVANKPGGFPTPVFLTNITMETYFQGANVTPPGLQINQVNQAACNGTEALGSCQPVWNSTGNQAQPVPGINTLIFATESCMGCHSSAGIYTSYDPATGSGNQSGQITGDFSWLLSQKASYYKGAPPVAPLARQRRTARRR